MTDGPTPMVNPDPNATADNLFVAAPDSADGNDKGSDNSVSVQAKTASEIANERFSVRFNHQDKVLTGQEMIDNAQKGLLYDGLVGKHGELNRNFLAAQQKAEQWDSFQENTVGHLLQYAQQNGLLVGRENNGEFNPLTADDISPAQPTVSPTESAMQNEIAELKGMLNSLIGHQAISQEEQTLRATGVSDQEIAAAKAFAIERGLPQGSLDIALTAVRANGPMPAQQQQQAQSSNGDELLDALKRLGLQAGGSGNSTGTLSVEPDLTKMTSEEQTRYFWEKSKKERGVQ